jgi:chemotaxis protein MotB
MAGKDGDKRPIIIKKIKKGGHGHHGGAWKVAYADFVTAMMAFFLLLWLLSTSSKSKLQGIAEYFTPTVGLKDGQGIGFKGGTGQSEIGTGKADAAQPGVVVGAVRSGQVAENPDAEAPVESEQDAKLFKEGGTAINQAINDDKTLQQLKNQISVQQTPEGLKIEISDSDKYPMFIPQTATLTDMGRLVLERMAKIVGKMPNYMAISGHTDASTEETGKSDYTNWELSTDRANAARRFLLKSGIDPQQPKKITGSGDKDLLVPNDPRSPRNRRVTLIMLRGSHVLIPDAMMPDNTDAEVLLKPEPAATPAAAPQAPTAAH